MFSKGLVHNLLMQLLASTAQNSKLKISKTDSLHCNHPQ